MECIEKQFVDSSSFTLEWHPDVNPWDKKLVKTNSLDCDWGEGWRIEEVLTPPTVVPLFVLFSPTAIPFNFQFKS